MVNKRNNKNGQSIGNKQGATQTAGTNKGSHRGDTDRTSSQGRKQSSEGSRNTNNRGQEKTV